MVSTGIEALDAQVGGLVAGRYYLLSGSPGSGKSSAALQFLGAGLTAGERCAILTQDDPQDLLAQAEFLGHDFRPAAEQDQLVVLQYRLDFRRNYGRASEPGRVFSELRSHFGEAPPDRLVIDSAAPFLEGGRISEDAQNAFAAFLDELTCATYLILPGELNDQYYRQEYDRLIAGSGGIFHFATLDGQQRELTIRKLRQQANSMDPLQFVIRPLVGIVESSVARPPAELPAAVRNRVVVLSVGARFPEELLAAVRQTYDVAVYETVADGFAELAAGQYGALLVAVSPRDANAAFQLTRQLRKAGNGAPIFYYAASEGLRGSTRALGLKSGGDDFLTDENGPQECLERISMALDRGHRHQVPDPPDVEPLVLQPKDAGGAFMLMEEGPFRAVLRSIIERASHPFFAVVLLRPGDVGRQEAWRILSTRLRVKEGDLGATLEDGRIALYLHDVRRRHVDELMARILETHPGMVGMGPIEVYCYPADRTDVERWLEREPAGAETAAARR